MTARLVIALVAGLACTAACARVDSSDATPTESNAKRMAPPRMDPPGLADAAFRGRVEERVPAGSYCYLAVVTDAGARHWVATMGSGVPVGTRVEVKSIGVRASFRSPRLGRTFEHLVFGIVRRRG